jgi:hypothetical protein
MVYPTVYQIFITNREVNSFFRPDLIILLINGKGNITENQIRVQFGFYLVQTGQKILTHLIIFVYFRHNFCK